MVKSNVLKFGDFTLKSGRKSPFFMNAGSYSSGSELLTLGQFYAKAIYENFGDDFDVLFGPAYKGIPLAVATSIAYFSLYGKEKKYSCDRKEAKDHGADKGDFLGYKIKDGDKVIIVEDVTTSGKSIDEVLPKIKSCETENGAIKIVGEIVSLNRMEKAQNSEKTAFDAIQEKYGFPVRAIISMNDVIDALYTNGDKKIITDEIKARLDEYYKIYGV